MIAQPVHTSRLVLRTIYIVMPSNRFVYIANI